MKRKSNGRRKCWKRIPS